MFQKIKIFLELPNRNPVKKGRFFSLRLKQILRNEDDVSRRARNTFVISDTGGDFESFCKILGKGNVINKYLQWTFGNGHLIILGNCLDDSSDAVECLWLIYGLEERAKKKGGYIHFILGNNELQGINGAWRFQHPKYAVSNGNIRSQSTALYDGSNELYRWLKTKNIVERIGHILFVHGSLSAKLLYSGLSVGEINNLARSYIRTPNQIFNSPTLNDFFNSISNDVSSDSLKFERHSIDSILLHFNVKMVVSCYQSGSEVNFIYNNKIINVHVDHKSGKSEGLLISGQRFLKVSTWGPSKSLL